MSLMRSTAAIAFVVSLGLAGGAQATPLNNGGFETGDLTGWVATKNTGSIVVDNMETPPSGGNNSIKPESGHYFVRMGGGSAGKDVTLTQSFSMNKGHSVFVSARFLRNVGTLTTNDTAQLVLIDPDNVSHLLYSTDILSVGSLTNDPWTAYHYLAKESGTYKIVATTTNVGSGGTRSMFLLDNARVPEPASLGLLGMALLAAGAAARRRLKRAAA